MRTFIILSILAIFLFVSISTVETQEATQDQQEKTQQSEQIETKEMKKQRKAEEKRKAQELKQQQKIEEQERKVQEKLQREQAKLEAAEAKKQAEEELKAAAQAERQAQLEAEAASLCQSGEFKGTEGTCVQCSANCESCLNPTFCNYCQVGFYRVITEKKVASHCSNTIPQGYLPQINTLAEMNPQVNFTRPQGFAIALEGKRIITETPGQLPFVFENGAPVVDGQKIRLDVVPCRTQCQVCPEGFIKGDLNNECYTDLTCEFPHEVVQNTETGEKICKQNDGSIFAGKILLKQKLEKEADLPPQQKISLVALTNQGEQIGLSYTWSALDAQGTDISAQVLQTQFGRKVKGSLAGLQTGSVITFKVLIKDTKVAESTGNEVTLSHTIV